MSEITPATAADTYFAALAIGDIPSVMAMFADDVIWHQPGANRFSGEHRGTAGVGALLGGMMEASRGTFQLAVTGVPMVNGGDVAVPIRFSASNGDDVMDMAGVDLLTVRDGRIVAVRLFSEDSIAEDAFWALKA